MTQAVRRSIETALGFERAAPRRRLRRPQPRRRRRSTSGRRATRAGVRASTSSGLSARAPSRSSPAPPAAGSSSRAWTSSTTELAAQDVLHQVSREGVATTPTSAPASSPRVDRDDNLDHLLPVGRRSDPPRAHQLRQHGAGLLPARRGRRGDRRRPDRAEQPAARGRRRPRADLLDRLRAQRRPAAPAAAPLRLVRGRGRLDPARLAHAAGARPLDRGHARERNVRRARARALPRGRAGAARRRGRGHAADRRRRTPERVRGSRPALRPRPALDRANRAADGLRRLGVPRPGARGRRRARGRRSSPPCRLARAEPERLALRGRASAYGYPAGFLARYFDKLRYSFGPRERAGLHMFFELARRGRRARRDPTAALRGARGGPRRDRRPGDPRQGARRASGSPTRRRWRSCARATCCPSGAPPTSCASGARTPSTSPSSSTGTSTTRTSASPTATSAPSTAAPATGTRATCCRSRSSSRRSRRRSRSAAPACSCRAATTPTSGSTTTRTSSARSRSATRSTCTCCRRPRSSTSRAARS